MTSADSTLASSYSFVIDRAIKCDPKARRLELGHYESFELWDCYERLGVLDFAYSSFLDSFKKHVAPYCPQGKYFFRHKDIKVANNSAFIKVTDANLPAVRSYVLPLPSSTPLFLNVSKQLGIDRFALIDQVTEVALNKEPFNALEQYKVDIEHHDLLDVNLDTGEKRVFNNLLENYIDELSYLAKVSFPEEIGNAVVKSDLIRNGLLVCIKNS